MSGGCSSNDVEPFALMVMGDSMTPEFQDGAIIIVDQAAPCGPGAYAVIDYQGETTFRQYIERDGKKFLHALKGDEDDIELVGKYTVRGVVIQQKYKRKVTHYDWSPVSKAH